MRTSHFLTDEIMLNACLSKHILIINSFIDDVSLCRRVGGSQILIMHTFIFAKLNI